MEVLVVYLLAGCLAYARLCGLVLLWHALADPRALPLLRVPVAWWVAAVGEGVWIVTGALQGLRVLFG